MNRDNEQLLDDVLAEAAPADFREALLGETLGLVRRGRRLRRARNAVLMVALALALPGIFLLRNHARRPVVSIAPPVARTVPASYTLVTTQPLSAGSMVATRPLESTQMVTTETEVATVETGAGNFRVIDDEELLALMADHPAVLVRTGPQSEKLIFANPADQKGFATN